MEAEAVVKGLALDLLAALGIGPFLLAGDETHEVGHGPRGVVLVELGHDLALGGLEVHFLHQEIAPLSAAGAAAARAPGAGAGFREDTGGPPPAQAGGGTNGGRKREKR